MKRRWIIRSFFIALILSCLVAWGWSTTHEARIEYYRGGHWVSTGIFWGGVQFSYGPPGPGNLISDGWLWRAFHHEPVHFFPPTLPVSFLGFGHYSTINMHIFIVPIWFVNAVLMATFCYGWLKTRTPRQPPAFPIEMSSASKTEPVA